jgi:chromosome segregation ATPase
MDKAENAMVTITKERYDHFIWEIERLREALKKANENHEHFEREWYLRGDKIERLRQENNRLRESNQHKTMQSRLDGRTVILHQSGDVWVPHWQEGPEALGEKE